MAQAELQQAVDLIKQKRYFEAQSLLAGLQSPEAEKMLRKLDQFLADNPDVTPTPTPADRPLQHLTMHPPHPISPHPRIEGTIFYCERCAKKSGPPMVECEYRPHDGCPYQLKKGPVETVANALVALVISFVFGGIPLFIIVGGESHPLPVLCFVSPFLAIGVQTFAAGIYILVGHQIALLNPTTGMMWQNRTMLGLEVYRAVSLGFESAAIDFSDFSRSEKFAEGLANLPASVCALKAEKTIMNLTPYAAAVLKATLVGLLAKNIISLHHPTLYRSFIGGPLSKVRKQQYIFRPNPNITHVDGELERRIVAAMHQFIAKGDHLTRPGGLTLVDIIRALYADETYTSSYSWLLDIVRQDAAARGIGVLESRPLHLGPLKASHEIYHPLPPYLNLALQTEILVDEITTSSPQFARYLTSKIKHGLNLVDPSD